MNRIFKLGNRYIQESDWKTIAVLKFCLLALGILMGMLIPKKEKKRAAMICGGIFTITYIPLMIKLIRLARSHS